MKSIFTSCLMFFAFLAIPSLAQSKQVDARQAEMKAKKIAFMSEYIGLTPQEAELFWPIYNEMQGKLGSCRKCAGSLCRAINENSSESDYLKAADQIVKMDEHQANIRREYHERFKKILSAKKLYLYYQSEHQYKKYLMKQIQQNAAVKK